jgi:hypothetical protein
MLMPIEDQPVFKTWDRPLPEMAADPAGETAYATKARLVSKQLGCVFDRNQESLCALEVGFSDQIVEVLQQILAGCGT